MTPLTLKNFTIVGPNQLTVMTPWQNLSFAVVTSVTSIKLLLFLTKQPWLFWLYLTGGAPPQLWCYKKNQAWNGWKSPHKVEDLIASSTAQDTPSKWEKVAVWRLFFCLFFWKGSWSCKHWKPFVWCWNVVFLLLFVWWWNVGLLSQS